MFHYSIFGATEGQIPSRGFSVVTFFGFSALQQPTLAQRIQERRRESPRRRSWFDRITGSGRGVILTLFGATEVKAPTLMEEYTALRSLVASGSISSEECRRYLDEMDSKDDWVALTFFGYCTTSRASRQRQVKALDAGEKAGMIPTEHRRQLDELIGAPATTMAGVIGRLAAQPA